MIFANVSYFWPDLPLPFGIIKTMLKPGGKLVFYLSGKERLDRIPMTATVFEEENGGFLIVQAGNPA